MQGVNSALPATAVRSVGVLIDQPPVNTPPVTTGACLQESCQLQRVLSKEAPLLPEVKCATSCNLEKLQHRVHELSD